MSSLRPPSACVEAPERDRHDLPRDAQLAAKALHEARIEGRSFGQELQRDLLLQFQVVCAVDLAHAAAAKEAEDAIPLAEDYADGKAAVTACVGRSGPSEADDSRASEVRA